MKQPDAHRGAASPVVVFSLLLALIAAVVGAAVVLGEGAEEPAASATPMGTADPTPDHSLTDAEAIAVFRELDRIRLEAFAQADQRLLEAVFIPGGPSMRRAARAIEELHGQRLRLIHKGYRTRRLHVATKSSEDMHIRQTVSFRTTFRGPGAKDQLSDDRSKLQVIEWVLVEHRGEWRIKDGAVLEARFLK